MRNVRMLSQTMDDTMVMKKPTLIRLAGLRVSNGLNQRHGF